MDVSPIRGILSCHGNKSLMGPPSVGRQMAPVSPVIPSERRWRFNLWLALPALFNASSLVTGGFAPSITQLRNGGYLGKARPFPLAFYLSSF